MKSVDGGKTRYFAYSKLTGSLLFMDEATDGRRTDYAEIGALARVRLVDGTTPTYVHVDTQGSSLAATDAAGAVLWRESYQPFGAQRLDPLANRNNTGFTGHFEDDSTNLTYMQARYYDPITGRFLSADPIGYQDQLNLYAYVHNDPVNLTDPNGEGAIGWAARLVKGGLVRGRAIYEKRLAVEARRRGESVIAANRQTAGAIERAAADDPGSIIRHGGHELRDGSGAVGSPHFQTEGRLGHTFWSAVTGAVIALEVIEQLDPYNIDSTACPVFECGNAQERAAASASFSTVKQSGSNQTVQAAGGQVGPLFSDERVSITRNDDGSRTAHVSSAASRIVRDVDLDKK